MNADKIKAINLAMVEIATYTAYANAAAGVGIMVTVITAVNVFTKFHVAITSDYVLITAGALTGCGAFAVFRSTKKLLKLLKEAK